MRRREVLAGALLVVTIRAAQAHQPDRVRRISMLLGYAASDPQAEARIAAFRQRLRDFGWTQDDNVHFDLRWTGGDRNQLLAVAKEMIDLEPDVILAATTPVVAALSRETRTIPMVFVSVSDPIGSGFVESLPSPGGNITGFINIESSLGSKWLGLLKEIAPNVKRVAMMFNPEDAPYAGYYFRAFEAAAGAMGVEPTGAAVRSDSDIAEAIAALGREPRGGLLLLIDSFTAVHRQRIISLAASHRVSAIYSHRYMV